MRVLFYALFLFLFVTKAICEVPHAIESLESKFNKISGMRFKYVEEHPETLEENYFAGAPRYEGIVSVATGGRLFITYQVRRQFDKTAETGSLLSDGIHVWHFLPKNDRLLEAPIVYKFPVDFSEQLSKQLQSRNKLFSSSANCSIFERLLPSEFTTMWPPVDFYQDVKKRNTTCSESSDGNTSRYFCTIKPKDGNCSKVDFWINADGTLSKFILYSNNKQSKRLVGTEAQYSDFEKNVTFNADLFVFNAEKYPNANIIQWNPSEVADRLVNQFAAPAKIVFEKLFNANADSVTELNGTGHSWFNYSYHVRFKAQKLPPLRSPLDLKPGSCEIGFFKTNYPSDKDILSDTQNLECRAYHHGKEHFGVTHHKKAGIFFVRAWGDE